MLLWLERLKILRMAPQIPGIQLLSQNMSKCIHSTYISTMKGKVCTDISL